MNGSWTVTHEAEMDEGENQHLCERGLHFTFFFVPSNGLQKVISDSIFIPVSAECSPGQNIYPAEKLEIHKVVSASGRRDNVDST